MDSIDRNQTEDTRAHLSGADAIERVRDIADGATTCFFCTLESGPGDSIARPMAVREVDEAGNLWFLSSLDSDKNHELTEDTAVRLYFQEHGHSGFMVLNGRASVSTDRERIHELWSPYIKSWFTEGKNDPRLSAICVTPESGYYWDNKHGDLVATAKILAGALIGKTMDDSIQGRLEFGGTALPPAGPGQSRAIPRH